MHIQSMQFFPGKGQSLSSSWQKGSYLIDLSPNDWLDFPRNSARWKILQQSLLLSSWAFSSGRNYVSLGEDKAILWEPYIALFTSTMTTLVMSPLCKHLSNHLVYLVEEILHENGFSLMEVNINYTYLLALCPFPCDHPHTSSQNLLALIFSLFYMRHVTNELNHWHNWGLNIYLYLLLPLLPWNVNDWVHFSQLCPLGGIAADSRAKTGWSWNVAEVYFELAPMFWAVSFVNQVNFFPPLMLHVRNLP